MRLGQPRLPSRASGEDMTRTLLLSLRAVVDQLNNLSDGLLVASNTATHAPPTTGPHARGDFVRNNAPAAGGVFGWVCVQAGEPGLWKPVLIGA